MTWVRLDDAWFDHPKFLEVPELAQLLWVKALTYCARHLTDGHVPRSVVTRLLPVRSPGRYSEALVAAGLWEVVDGGFQIHDYLEYQRSSEQVRADRDANCARVSKWREKHRNGVTPPLPTALVTPPPLDPIPTDPNRDPPVVPQGGRISPDVDSICEHWRAQAYHRKPPVASEQHRRTVRARLKDGFTVDQLKAAIDHAMKDDWLAGRTQDGRPKKGLTEILQNTDRINRLCEFAAPATSQPEPEWTPGGPTDPGLHPLLLGLQ